MNTTTTYGLCQLTLAQGRAEARDASELVTQLLFGQGYEVLEEKEKWLRIRIADDKYTCWLDRKQHNSCSKRTFEQSLSLSRTHIALAPSKQEGSLSYIIGGSVSHDAPSAANFEQIRPLSLQYLHAPYLWGGKSILGIDCSGFTQVVFSMLGILLPRDAYQQAEIGQTVSFVQECQTGDLAYFDNAEGKIIHVGIVLVEEDKIQIIHASGRIRIDSLDHNGIYMQEEDAYSHNLRIIKRVQQG